MTLKQQEEVERKAARQLERFIRDTEANGKPLVASGIVPAVTWDAMSSVLGNNTSRYVERLANKMGDIHLGARRGKSEETQAEEAG